MVSPTEVGPNEVADAALAVPRKRSREPEREDACPEAFDLVVWNVTLRQPVEVSNNRN